MLPVLPEAATEAGGQDEGCGGRGEVDLSRGEGGELVACLCFGELGDRLERMVAHGVVVETGSQALDVTHERVGLDGVQGARGGASLPQHCDLGMESRIASAAEHLVQEDRELLQRQGSGSVEAPRGPPSRQSVVQTALPADER